VRSASDILTAILSKPTDIEHVRSLVAPDVTYVSLNYENPHLKKIMPWCGTSHGPEAIVKTFTDVARFWKQIAFEAEETFGNASRAAMFGRFTYESRVLEQIVTSPFAVLARVENNRCTYLQFMEDTFATGASFRSGGSWVFRSDPRGESVTI
jgi:uncharacterized protein